LWTCWLNGGGVVNDDRHREDRRSDGLTRDRLGAIQVGYLRLGQRIMVILITQTVLLFALGIAVAFLYGHQSAADQETARKAGVSAAMQAAARIQRSRAESVRQTCRDQNRRHARTVHALERLLVRSRVRLRNRRAVAIREHELALSLGGEPEAHAHAVRFVDALLPQPTAAGTIQLINALAPAQDCERLVRNRVGPVPTG
jgi:hypothetical protein